MHDAGESTIYTCNLRTVSLFVVNHKFVLVASASQLVGDKFSLSTNQAQFVTPWVKKYFRVGSFTAPFSIGNEKKG